MGWVYYANYYAYFEVGRTELIRKTWKPYSELEKEGLRLPVLESGCRYYEGARYDDTLRIETVMSNSSPARLHFAYKVFNETSGTLAAEGFTIHCFMNPSGRAVRIPLAIQNLLID